MCLNQIRMNVSVVFLAEFVCAWIFRGGSVHRKKKKLTETNIFFDAEVSHCEKNPRFMFESNTYERFRCCISG